MGPRVLVVDDHPGFRHQARLLLSEAGYDVVGEAGSAAAAVDVVRQLRPDVVLLDVGLPDRDGFAVAEVLATEPEPPAVVLGDHRQPDHREHRRGRRRGCRRGCRFERPGLEHRVVDRRREHGGGLIARSFNVRDSLVADNRSSGNGGGLRAPDFVGVTRSTVAGNTTSGRGAGIYAGLRAEVDSSTVTGNEAYRAGGIYVDADELE